MSLASQVSLLAERVAAQFKVMLPLSGGQVTGDITLKNQPAASDNSAKVTTTAWVRAFVSSALSGIAGASVAQVGDVKIFHGQLGGSDGRRPLDGKTGVADEAWELCDGTNGTPDLRGKLVYGAGGTLALGAAYGDVATSVDKAGFDYALGVRSGQTTTTVLTSPPQGIGLYYLKKTS